MTNISTAANATPRFQDKQLYDGVRTRRILACMIDYLLIFLLCIPCAICIVILGIITFGFGWLFFFILAPIVALGYVALTMGGPCQATLGMQIMGIKLVRLNEQSINGLLAIAHTMLFWAGNAILTPLILLATFFFDYKRTVHDLLLDTVVIRSRPLE